MRNKFKLQTKPEANNSEQCAFLVVIILRNSYQFVMKLKFEDFRYVNKVSLNDILLE